MKASIEDFPYDHIQVSLQQDARAIACYRSKIKVTQTSGKEWFQMINQRRTMKFASNIQVVISERYQSLMQFPVVLEDK